MMFTRKTGTDAYELHTSDGAIVGHVERVQPRTYAFPWRWRTGPTWGEARTKDSAVADLEWFVTRAKS